MTMIKASLVTIDIAYEDGQSVNDLRCADASVSACGSIEISSIPMAKQLAVRHQEVPHEITVKIDSEPQVILFPHKSEVSSEGGLDGIDHIYRFWARTDSDFAGINLIEEEPKMAWKEITTASAVLNLHNMPLELGKALHKYNALRERHDYWEADRLARLMRRFDRLYLGLSRISSRSIHRLAQNCDAKICMGYVKERNWDLMHLFYWNGSPELTEKILMLAWKKGIKK